MSEDGPLTGVTTAALVVCLVGVAIAGSGMAVGTAAAGNATTVGSCTNINAPGLYKLDENITRSAAGSCLNVTANDVVLDGQGYTLQGPGEKQDQSVGVKINATRNVTVRNLNVTTWEFNVYIDGLTDGTVTNLNTTDAISDDGKANEAGVAVRNGTDIQISDVYAAGNGDAGINVTGAENVTVTSSTVVENEIWNVHFEQVSNGTVRSVNASAAMADKSYGFHANASANLTVADSQFLGNDHTGVALEATDDSRLANVTASHNGEYGIELDQYWYPAPVLNESNNNRIVDSTVVDNDWHGIVITDSANNTILNNTVTDHSRTGILLQTADTVDPQGFESPTIVENITVTDNTLRNNDEGIRLTGDARAQDDEVSGSVRNVTLRNNTVRDGEEGGIVLTSAKNVTMRENVLAGNGRDLMIGEFQRGDPSHSLAHFRHDIDTSNTVSGDPVHYYRNVSDLTVGTATNAGFVGIVDARNVTVENLDFEDNSHAVLAANATGATVRKISSTDNRRAIELVETTNSTVADNDIDDPVRQSIALYYAENNTVRGNTINQTTGGDVGIMVAGSADNLVVGNDLYTVPGERGGVGIHLQDLASEGGSGNTVLNNTVIGTRIDIATVRGTDVRRNDIRQTGADGVNDDGEDTRIRHNDIQNVTTGVTAGSNATVRNNTVVDAEDYGVDATLADVVVKNNTLNDIGTAGIEVTGDSVNITGNTVETATSGVNTVSYAADVTIENNTFRNITGTNDDEAGVYDEADEGSGTTVRDNRFVNNSHALRLRGYGTVTNNSVVSSDVSIWVDSEAAETYDITDNTVDNSSRWAYYNVYDFSSGSSGWPGSVTNLSLPNATVSFTDREAALVGTTQPACDPSGRVNQGVFLNTSNTSANAWLDLTVHYDGVIDNSVDESSLTLYRLDDGTWTELSTTRDTTAGTVTANITQFGTVGLFADGTPTCPAPASFQVSTDSTTSPVVAGNTLDITVTVENTGVQTGTQTVTFATNGTQRDTTSVTLDGGQSKTVTLSWATGAGDAGSYTATVESENDTDTAAVRVDATPTPALEVTLDSTTAPVTEGDTLEMTGTVENVGTAESDQDLILWVDGTNVDDDSMGLDPGESDTTTLDWDTASGDAGTHNITLSIKNDTESTDVTVQPAGGASPANFSMTVDGTTSPVTEGDTLDVTATVDNVGGETGTQTVALGTSGTVRDTTTVTLQAGNSVTKTLSWQTSVGDAGSYTTTVESENDTATAGATVQAASSPSQTANFTVDLDSTNSPVTEGGTLTVDATVTNDGSAAGSQTVDLTVGGTVRDSTTVSLGAGGSTGVSLSWATAAGDAGSYTATVASKNDTDTASVSVDTTGTAPSATFTTDPATTYVGESVSLNASNSTDSDGSIVEYAWDYDGDGVYDETRTTPTSVIAYSTAGNRTVGLRVTDDDGNTDTTTRTVEIVSGAPTAALSASSKAVLVGESVSLNASNTTDPTDDIKTYEWDYDGDGVYDETRSFPESSIAYSTVGERTVRVRVTDEHGATDTANVTVSVDEADFDGGGDSNEDGGGSAGGGGGGSTDDGGAESTTVVETATLTDGSTDVEIRNSRPGATASVNLDATAGDATLKGLDITADSDRESLGLTVRSTADTPGQTPALDTADPLGYVEVEHDAPNDAYGPSTFRFEVSQSALPDGATLDDVSLYRYHEGTWDTLNTTRDGTAFEASTPGFSVFAVGVSSPDQTTTSTPDATTTRTPDPAQSTTDGDESEGADRTATAVTPDPRGQETSTTGAGSPGFGPLVALLALVLVAGYLASRRR
jgi:PGF-pre-PGF domain-containing protein/PGF-CTERM protein